MLRPCLLTLLLAGCAAAPSRVIVGLEPGARVDLDTWLAAHPLAASEELKAVPVGATGTTSYAIVQVRGRERAHVHADHDLTVHVLRGRGHLVLASMPEGSLALSGEIRPLSPGDIVAIPRGMVHWFVNGGKEPAVAVACFTPPYDGKDIVTTPLVSQIDGWLGPLASATPSRPILFTGTRTGVDVPFSLAIPPAGRP
jgi:mannose-6-phosphate isomerase-like protein (cupin superfamily)